MRVYSIFRSIDGEVNHFHQGRFSTFIRLAGCNLRCAYCDTLYAQEKDSGTEMSVAYIVKEIEKLNCWKVTITGGEPLLQAEELFELLRWLNRNEYRVSVETNGSQELLGIGVGSWVLDYKLPSSGMMDHMKIIEHVRLGEDDFVKFVIMDEKDFKVASETMLALQANRCRATFAFSPVDSVLDPKDLMRWIEESTGGFWTPSDVVVNLQLHKYIGLVEDK